MSMRQSAPAPQRAWTNNPAAMTTGAQAVVHKPSDRLASCDAAASF